MSDTHHEKERKARKAYTCDECRRPIKPGTVYSYCSGIYDGEPYSHRFCLRCKRAWRRAWDRFRWDHPDDAPAIGSLRHYMWSERSQRVWAWDKDRRDRVKRLRAEGKHELADRWEREARRG